MEQFALMEHFSRQLTANRKLLKQPVSVLYPLECSDPHRLQWDTITADAATTSTESDAPGLHSCCHISWPRRSKYLQSSTKVCSSYPVWRKFAKTDFWRSTLIQRGSTSFSLFIFAGFSYNHSAFDAAESLRPFTSPSLSFSFFLFLYVCRGVSRKLTDFLSVDIHFGDQN